MAERGNWFVRRNGVVKGPFLSVQITRNILLGRLHFDDELSPDKQSWEQVAEHRELYPDVMGETSADDNKLEVAKVQVDERVLEQRKHKQDMAQERRQTRDRRGSESEVMLVHREHRNEMDDIFNDSFERPKLPTVSIIFAVIVTIVFGFILKPQKQDDLIDCSISARPEVNWSNCRFIKLYAENQNLQNAILTDTILNESYLLGTDFSDSDMAYAEIKKSDLSYANLQRVRLIGANLIETDLRYANLEDADLSYADLSGAKLAGANTKNTRFDNAIWVDGHVCEKGSIGSCKMNK